MRVPLLDLKAHHEPLREELLTAIREVIDSSAFAGGPFDSSVTLMGVAVQEMHHFARVNELLDKRHWSPGERISA